jgi:beta-galactosidase
MSKKFPPIIAKFPHILHGGDYNPDQWLKYPGIIDDDFRLMELAGCNTFSIGIFSWTSLEPQEEKFTFEWLDNIMDRLAKKGYNAIIATPSGARPAWMAAKYPEVRRVRSDGLREPFQMRHNHCWTSPVYREKVRIINTRLVERYKEHPALAAWHISNELSGECFCDLCLKSWYEWLEKKYKTLDALNDAWWSTFWSHRYSDWSQIDPRDHSVDGLRLDWKRFTTWQCCEFMRWEIAPLKKVRPDVPVTTNFMGVFCDFDYWQMAQVVDVISDDAYPVWFDHKDNTDMAILLSMTHDMNRAMKNGKPFFLMECCPSATNWQPFHHLKRPLVHQREMLLALAHGADGTLYFQWRKSHGAAEKFHGAVIDHVGHENTRVFKEIAAQGALYKKLDGIIGTSVEPEVAMVYDWDCKRALEFSSGPANESKKYMETFKQHYRPFWQAGISVDVIQATCAFDKFKVVVLPMLFMLKPGVADKISAFVKNGGTVIATYLTGIVDAYSRCFLGGWPGEGLRKVFGIWNEEVDGLPVNDIQQVSFIEGNKLGIKGSFSSCDYCELVHAEGAQVLAVYKKEFYAGMPALTVNNYGKGRAYYLATRGGPELLTAITGAIIRQNNLVLNLPKGLPYGVTAQRRTDGDHEFIFVLNFMGKKQIVNLGKEKFVDLATGKTIKESLNLVANGSMVLKRI